jgi:hypothetical protein
MELHKFIDKHYDGNVAHFAKDMGKSPQLIAHRLANGGYEVRGDEVVKVIEGLTRKVKSHLKGMKR